jgi:hypothetical protein
MQRVTIKGQSSEWGVIDAGVPQGSNLGPLLFLIFINDLAEAVNCSVKLFADDTCLFIEIEEKVITEEQLNEDLNNINTWANDWLVTFSSHKTKSLTISKKIISNSPDNIMLRGSKITEVDSHKHLGVTLSKDLRWSKHIHDIETNANKRLNLMKHFKFKLDRRSLEVIYTSYIRPTLEYADCVWYGAYAIDLDLLDNVQVNAMRIMTGATARSNINKLYEETGWPTLESRRSAHMLAMFYKIVTGTAPSYLVDLLPQTVNDRTA